MRIPTLERSGQDLPVYRRIAESIRSQIDSGELAPGDRLLPIRTLARELGVNRDTAALAYEALAGEGLLESTVGRGTFVRSEPVFDTRAGAGTPVALAPPIDRLLAFEAARPRFGATDDVASLHSLIPDPAFYPADEFRRALNRVLSEGGAELFLYGGAQGHPGLREVLAERFTEMGVRAGAEEVVLCHGASQGISLALRLFAEAGDAVAVEVPTYHNVLATLVALGIRAQPVAMDDDGPDPVALERALARPDVKAFYTIPTFHNPLGTSATAARRRAVLEIAERCGKPVIEDAFESDLRYTGRALPALAALDRAERVVHLSSFSKSLFPGVRVGSLLARGRAVEGLVALKHATDLSDSMPLQAALAEFIRSGDYDRHLVRMRRRLHARRDALLAALEREMPSGATWTRPEGGYQLWLELPFEVDTRDLLADAARAGVLFAPGSQFLPDRRPSNAMRLTVARADEGEIERGVAALGAVVRERLDADPTARQVAGVHL